MEKKGNVSRILEGNSKGKRPQRKPVHRGKNNIKIDFRGVGWGVMDYIRLAQDRDQ